MSYAFPRLRQQLANWLLPDVFIPVINMSQKSDLKFILQYVWVIDQVCSVKMAGYWPSSFLRVYGPRTSRGP